MFRVVDASRRMRRDVSWNLVPVVLLATVGLALNFTIGGYWGPRALGAFNLATTAMFSFAVLAAGGLQFAVLRAVAEDPDDRARVAAVTVGALVPNLALAVVTTAAFVALRHPIGELVHSELVPDGLLWATPALFCFAINKTLMGVCNGLRRMRAFAVYTSLRYLLIAAGLGIAIAWDLRPEQLPVIWSISEGVLMLVLIVELVATVSLRRCRGWTTWAKRHIDYGMRSVLSTLAWEVNSKLDIWVVGMVIPDENIVGIYTLASVIYEGVLQLPVVVQNNVNPLIAKYVSEGALIEVETLAKKQRRWFVPAMIGVVAIGAALYPYVVPWLVQDDTFGAGALPFAILMGGIALSSAYLPFNQALLMASRPGWHTVYVILTVTVAATALGLMTPVWGIAGAAAATAVGLVASAVLLRVMVQKTVGIRL